MDTRNYWMKAMHAIINFLQHCGIFLPTDISHTHIEHDTVLSDIIQEKTLVSCRSSPKSQQ